MQAFFGCCGLEDIGKFLDYVRALSDCLTAKPSRQLSCHAVAFSLLKKSEVLNDLACFSREAEDFHPFCDFAGRNHVIVE